MKKARALRNGARCEVARRRGSGNGSPRVNQPPSPRRRAALTRCAIDRRGVNPSAAVVKPNPSRCALIAAAFFLLLMPAFASLYEIPLKDIDGGPVTLAPHRGEVLLIVNVASKCGLTPQYEALEAQYQKYRDAGFTVLGVPCNQFGGQEPGSNEEIKAFCSAKFGVTFPLFDKVDVNGAERHPLYVALAGKDAAFPGDIGWNFAKFLVSRDGRVLQRFEPGVKPDAPEVTAAIEAALASSAK